MPRTPKSRGNALVASAARVTGRRLRGVPASGGALAWQDEAWKMVDSVGELEYYREWYANAGSLISLYVQHEAEDGTKTRVETGLPAQALNVLFGGEDGQQQMMSSFFSLLSVPGESWLVGLVEPPQDPGTDQWRVLSRDEVRKEAGFWVIDRGDGVQERYRAGDKEGEEAEVYVARIWRPHPRKGVEATSAVRAALPVLRKIIGLDQKTSADIDSRMSSAGLLLVPTEASFVGPATSAAAAGDPDLDPLIATLIDVAEASLNDRSDPSSVVPAIGRMPGQYIKDVKHITFWSEFSESVGALEDRSLKRLATALDAPVEVLMGMADVNHWTGWLLDDNGIKKHISPTAGIVTHGLTTQYLWPVLAEAAGGVLTDEHRRYTIEADTSRLRQRPNLSAEASTAHAALTITDAAYAREVGFAESDLLTPEKDPEEYARRVLEAVAKGPNQTLALAALAQLGVPLDPALVEAYTVATPSAAATSPLPSAPERPAIETRTPPDPDGAGNPASVAALAAAGDAETHRRTALVLAAEGIVDRAIERAYNRAGKRRGGVRAVPADQMEAALVGAWDRVPRVAALTRTDPFRLQQALDSYTRTLLAAGAPHDPHAFAETLDAAVLSETA